MKKKVVKLIHQCDGRPEIPKTTLHSIIRVTSRESVILSKNRTTKGPKEKYNTQTVKPLLNTIQMTLIKT